jgi:GR25 family glycosyltransferase involved in LPS biosynthesis
MPTEIAALRSHYNLLKFAHENNFESILILEDDVDFCDDFKNKLSAAMLELPYDWECLHLAGSSPIDCLIQYSPLLDRCLKSWGGYAYIVRHSAIPKLLSELEKEQTQLDTHYTWIMKDMKWYKTKEMLVYHLPGYSEIMKQNRDIKELYIK